MKTFIIEGKEITVPQIDVTHLVTEDQVDYTFTIMEGDHQGIQFRMTNMRIDDNDTSLMWYDLETAQPEDVDKIKPIVDNFILMILHEQIERDKNGQNEIGETSPADA